MASSFSNPSSTSPSLSPSHAHRIMATSPPVTAITTTTTTTGSTTTTSSSSNNIMDTPVHTIHDIHLPSGPRDGLEDVLKYDHAGFRPTLLDELLHERYLVENKLGHGGFSTIWLCRDTQDHKWVAVKIFAVNKYDQAENELRQCREISAACLDKTELELFGLALDGFVLDSPQGKHQCLVSEVHGPQVDRALALLDQPSQVRQVCRSLTQGLKVLHSKSIYHGDFRPANILLSLHGFSSLSTDHVRDKLDPPCLDEVRVNGEPIESLPPASPLSGKIPPYLVYPVSPLESCSLTPATNARLIDLGSSGPDIVIPASYRAPEIMAHYNQNATAATDLWALACTIFQVRTGYHLLEFWFFSEAVYLQQVASLLGVPEEGYDSELREKHGPVKGERAAAVELKSLLAHCTDLKFPVGEREREDLADLLAKLLRWKPEERLSAERVLGHRWFSTQY